MVRNVIAGAAAWLMLGAAAFGHHSVAVNFDNSKPVRTANDA